MIGTGSQDELEQSIASARKKLTSFEEGASTAELLARLRASQGMHPFLLMRTFASLGAAGSVVAMVVMMATSVFSRDVAVTINNLESKLGFPLPIVFVILAACGLVAAVAGHFGAVSAARGAPYLPHEAKAHQRLLADVQQLEAQRAVKERMTPRPATPRLLDRRSSRQLS